MTGNSPKTVLVGAIAGAFGVRGEVRIKSFTQNPASMLDLAPWRDEHGRVVMEITGSRPVKGGFAVKSPQVQTREDAQAMKSTKLFCLRDQLPPPDEDEFYHVDLIGLAVESADGAALGQVKAVRNHGAGDLLEIAGTPGEKKTWMIPFTRANVPELDFAGGKVVIADWENYLPDGNAKPEAGES